jgi:hypothetical protein
MRCPKCGYISFDYNKVCPKCNKDITAEQAKLNLPTFRPTPPSLLGILTGEANESNIGINADSSQNMDVSEMDLDFDDSVSMESEDLSYDDSHDMVISLDAEDSGEIDMPNALTLSDDEGLSGIEMGHDDKEGLEFSPFAPDTHKSQQDLMQASVELHLDDLKINETGELEIGDIFAEKQLDAGTNELLDLEGLSLEEPETAPADDEITFDDSGKLDLGDLEIEEPEDKASFETMEVDDLTMEDTHPEIMDAETGSGKPIVSRARSSKEEIAEAVTGELDLNALTIEGPDLEKDGLSMDDSFDLENMDLDDDLSLDLENLDIDLDLEEPEDKS